jgi:hypothetical protein
MSKAKSYIRNENGTATKKQATGQKLFYDRKMEGRKIFFCHSLFHIFSQ